MESQTGMRSPFAGRRFLLTGSTQGVGMATARALLDAGGTVTISGRREETVEAGIEAFKAYEGRVFGKSSDLTEQESAGELIRAAHQRMGGLDGLVLSHGGSYHPTPFEEYDTYEFPALADYIFLSLARTVHAAVPRLAESPYGGRIVSVISDASRFPTPGESMIGALAAANIMFMRTLAKELPERRYG